MNPTRKLHAFVAATAGAGLVTLVVAALETYQRGFGPPSRLVPFTLVLAAGWARPLLLPRGDETEGLQLDEAFLVAMALLLPPLGTLGVVCVAVALGLLARRRPLMRAVFNVSQMVTAAGLGLWAMSLIAPVGAARPALASLIGATAGAAVFLVANGGAVSAAVALSEGTSFWAQCRQGFDVRLLVWAATVSIGLLAGIGGAAEPWALGLAVVPLAGLQAVLGQHMRARRDRERMNGLFEAAIRAHRTIGRAEVEEAVTASARALLRCQGARIDRSGPSPGELGLRWPDRRSDRWLVVSQRRGVEPFQAADAKLLEALVAIGSGAMDNAHLVEEIRHQAIHDALTGLPNQVLFKDRLEHALAQAARAGERVGVVFLDLDHFKVVNDSMGHVVGDKLLVEVAERLTAALRPGDTVARLGGDEFVVLCERIGGREDALAVADRLRAGLAAPVLMADAKVAVTASVGIAVSSGRSTAGDLLRDADAAMYRAKERGKDRAELFDDALRTRAVRRLSTERTLRQAIDEGRLRVFYQPIVELDTGVVRSTEALLRIELANGTLLSPADFIEVAEESGLIATIGLGVLDESCRQAVAWRRRFGAGAPRIAVNLSARQLSRMAIADAVEVALAETGATADMLALEITETVLMEASQPTLDDLRRLRAMGVSIGLDDFGTGYSSLTYLKRLPISFVKVDKSFVSGLGENPDDDAIVSAVVGLGQAMGLVTVAEGVETSQQLDHLRRLGCHSGQGYYFSKPKSAMDLTALLEVSSRGSAHDAIGEPGRAGTGIRLALPQPEPPPVWDAAGPEDAGLLRAHGRRRDGAVSAATGRQRPPGRQHLPDQLR